MVVPLDLDRRPIPPPQTNSSKFQLCSIMYYPSIICILILKLGFINNFEIQLKSQGSGIQGIKLDLNRIHKQSRMCE
jgi:hypothetical protein